MVFFVIDKTTKMLGIFRPTEDFIRGGERKVEDAIEVYDKFFGENATDNVNSFIMEEELF